MNHRRAELLQSLQESYSRIIELLLEEEIIKLHEIPYIEGYIHSRLGELKQRLEVRELEVVRLRKKTSLMRMELKSTGRIDEERVESRLKAEMRPASVGSLIHQNEHDHLLEQTSQQKQLSMEETSKLYDLYRSIISSLHPALNKQGSWEMYGRFRHARHAFRTRSLPHLRAIERVSRRKEVVRWDDLTTDELTVELALLESAEAVFTERVSELKASYPFTMKEWMEDPDWILVETQRLMTQISEAEDELKHLSYLIEGMKVSIPLEGARLLVETHIAGTSHVPSFEIQAQDVHLGSLLELEREPGNPVDSHAVLVLTLEGHKLGYIPSVESEYVAYLLDGSESVFARVVDFTEYDNWNKIGIQIYLDADRLPRLPRSTSASGTDGEDSDS